MSGLFDSMTQGLAGKSAGEKAGPFAPRSGN